MTLIHEFPEQQLPTKLKSGYKYTTDNVKTDIAIDQLNAMVREAFKDATIDDNKAADILRRNVKAGFGLYEESTYDTTKRLVGSAECWPITYETLKRLKLGEGVENGLSEADLELEHLIPESDIDKTEAIYIPSVVVEDVGTPIGSYRAGKLMIKFLRYIQKTFRQAAINQNGLHIFIVCFSDAGENMTQKIASFFKVREPSGQVVIYGETKPYYEIFISAEEWDSRFYKTRLKWSETALYDE